MEYIEQIQSALWVIIVAQTILLILIINISKKRIVSTGGITLGKKIPNLNYTTINNDYGSIYNLLKNNETSYICAIKIDCKTCEKVIFELLSRLEKKNETFKFILFGNKDEIIEWKNKFNLDIPIYILNKDDMTTKLKINIFPMLISVNKFGEVLEKSYIDEKNIVNYVELKV
jgi:hypothetical protein